MAVGEVDVGHAYINPTFGVSDRSSISFCQLQGEGGSGCCTVSFDTNVGYRGMVGRTLSGEYDATNEV